MAEEPPGVLVDHVVAMFFFSLGRYRDRDRGRDRRIEEREAIWSQNFNPDILRPTDFRAKYHITYLGRREPWGLRTCSYSWMSWYRKVTLALE